MVENISCVKGLLVEENVRCKTVSDSGVKKFLVQKIYGVNGSWC